MLPTTLAPQPTQPVTTPAPADLPLRAVFEQQQRTRTEPAWLRAARRKALEHFEQTGYPTLRDEDWRFTSVAPVAALPFRPASTSFASQLSAAALARLPFHGLEGDRLVFVDGHFVPELSQIAHRTDGVVVTSLATALAHQPEDLEPHLVRHARADDNAFAALNQAFFTDGAFIRVPAGRVVAAPIRLVFLASGREPDVTICLRNLVLVEAGAQATVLEHSTSLDGATHVTNCVTELVTGDRAVVEHLKFQDDNARAFHVAGFHARIGRSVKLLAHSFALGARLARFHVRAGLHGEGAEAVLNGLYLANRERLADHHMIVDHARPQCASHEYYNGILSDRARGVFHGRILVQPGAQKTDAKQTNKNLLLSDEATVDTKPQLEIYADDVKCTHGATVGQLHPEQIFYLRARGIPEEMARQMLIHAFAGEIIDRVRCAPVREELDRLIWDRLEQQEHLGLGAHD